MIYDIRITLTYDYDAPADAGRHVLRLAPKTLAGVQQVVVAAVDFSPQPAERRDRVDFFGNSTVDIRYAEAVMQSSLTMRARVERGAARVFGQYCLLLDQLSGELAAEHGLGPDSPHHFRANSPRVPWVLDVAQWAIWAAGVATSVEETAINISNALHSEMTFDPDYTAVDMPLERAFAARRGVCQDYAHIMICALRSLGIPAGYVSGFLRTIPPEGQPRLEGADAMHAWVRVWCGRQTGWIELDPTNKMPVGEDHVVVAYGRDYFDVSPVKGQLRLSGGQKTTQSVDMLAVF